MVNTERVDEIAEMLKTLKHKRGIIKAAITRFNNFLLEHKQGVLDSRKIEQRIEKLKEIFEPFEALQYEIEINDSSVAEETHLSERFDTHEAYFDVIAEAEELLHVARYGPRKTPNENSTNVLSAAAAATDHSSISATAASTQQQGGSGAQRPNEFFAINDQNPVESHRNEVLRETPFLHNNIISSRRLFSDDNLNNRENTNVNTRETVSTTRRLKLPTISLPTFDGSYEDWLSFQDTFLSMIDSDDRLSDIDKITYLKDSVTGSAADKIKSIPCVGANYKRVWNLLERSYADNRLIISRHLSLLLRLPVQEKENSEGLRKLADDTLQHVESLATLGVTVTEEILVQNIEEKLHKRTAEKWEEAQKRGVFPKLEDMLEFLHNAAARLAKREDQRTEINPQSVSNKSKSNKTRKKGALNTGQAFLINTQTESCPICPNEKHKLFKCKKFRDLGVSERSEIVTRAGLCNCCLQKHEDKECKISKCLKCDLKHNVLLHTDA